MVEGAGVVVHAKPSYYPNRGTFSLYAREIRMVGLGELLARLERRRQLLAAEGLFAPERKRTLPFLPTCVGLVTAPNSAAERDVLDNARRRWPGVAFEVAYAAMQGPRAAGEVMEALDRLERDPRVDVIVVARGGGSVEDLLPFSDEALVRAVFELRTPVVSAIGHEPDQPAARPRRRRPRVHPDRRRQARRARRRRRAPRGHLGPRPGALPSSSSCSSASSTAWTPCGRRPALAAPASLIEAREGEVAQLRERARRSLRHSLDRAEDDLGHRVARVRALSPLATLRRGYAVLQDAEGHALTSVAGLTARRPVSARVADGRVHATVEPTSTALPDRTHDEPDDQPDGES